VKLFGRRKAIAAGTVPASEVFIGASGDEPDSDGEQSAPEVGDGVTGSDAPDGEAADAADVEVRLEGGSTTDDTPVTAPVPVVPGAPPEKQLRRRLRFGFDDRPGRNGDKPARELVPAGGGSTDAAEDAASGSVTESKKLISIGFDDELDDIETVSLEPGSPSGDIARPDVDARLRARRIQVRRDQGRRRLRWAIVGGAVLALLIGAGLVLESPLFAINDVQVTGATYTNPARLRQVVDDLDGATLIGADLGRAEATLAADPWVRRVRVERRPLRGVRIEIVEREPIATYMGTDQRWRVLDPTGRVLAVLDPPGSKPVDPLELVLPQPGPDLEPGATVPAPVTGAADVIPRLPPDLRTRTCSMGVGDVGQLTLNFCDGYVVDLGQPEGLRDKLVSAIYVLNSQPDQVALSGRLNVADPSHPVLIPK
jgi:cell division protein FtsQ